MSTPLTCLRPLSASYLRPRARAAYLRFYSAAQTQTLPRIRIGNDDTEKWQHKERYPRIKNQDTVLDYQTFKELHKNLANGASKPDDVVVVRGRSASGVQVALAHAVKEEYGRFALQAQSWHSLTCSKTASLTNCNPIDCNVCSTITI